MQTIKKMSCVALIVMLIFAISAPCFAAGAATLSAAENLVALWSLYCQSVGLDPVFSHNGVKSNINNPFSSSTAADTITDLYNQYCTYSGRIETVQQTVEWVKTNTAISVSVQQNGAFQYSAGVADFFNKFTTWMLEDVVGVIKNPDGFFNTSNWFNNTLYYHSTTGFLQINKAAAGMTITQINKAYINANGTAVRCDSNGNPSMYYISTSPDIYCFLVNDSSSGTVYFLTETSGSQLMSSAYANSSTYVSRFGFTALLAGTAYYYVTVNAQLNDGYTYPSLPSFNTLDDALSAGNSSTADRIQLGPKTISSDGTLGIPDVDANDYVAQPVSGELDLPSDQVNTIDDAIPHILTNTLANVASIADTLAQGVLTSIPFMPFGSLPSFNFGFSGIWHYVVEWVNSLGSGLSFFSSIWNNIPYAMVVPIWAAAVVVVVTSIFKRFV